MESEISEMHARYHRREAIPAARYSPLNAYTLAAMQERQWRLRRALLEGCSQPISEIKLLEIGCGGGGNLSEFLRFGFRPEHLFGNELLPERVAAARHSLPASLSLLPGDASTLGLAPDSFDIVMQSTVFTSILDNAFQQRLADRMWNWVKPGGFVLWYDFVYNNPKNCDVRGVPIRRIRELFPDGILHVQRSTLAPPIGRRVCQIAPILYAWFNLIPWLRTHIVCRISKLPNGSTINPK